MTLQEVANFLITKPGYLQWGDVRVANKLNVDLELVSIAKQHIKEGNIEALAKDIPNVLVLDIETAPIQAYVWGMWKQNLSLDSIESDWFILTWAAKWLYDDNAFGEALSPGEAITEDDGRIIKILWDVLEKADIVITHNGDKFDIKKINARFIEHGLGPVSPFKSIDTLKVSRKQFAFTSNKLDALAKKFGFDSKHKMTFQTWKDCLKGNETALNKMLRYNVQDVLVLENVYYKLRPWISNHPNLGLYMIDNTFRCPNCHSTHLKEVGNSLTSISKFKAYRCGSCGAISRERSTVLSTKQNKTLLTNV